MNQPKYNIGAKVYHILPESSAGVVTDVVYHYSTERFTYEVVFDVVLAPLIYAEHELTITKTFD